MNSPLVDALAQLNLEPGHIYRYEVKGRQIELRVLEEIPRELLPAPLVESDIMLDPWVELPEPTADLTTVCRLGDPDLPHAPFISDDEADQ